MPRFIAILEDNAERLAAMRAVLPTLLPSTEHVYFEDAGTMVLWLAESLADVVLISLDHDLPFWRTGENELVDAGTGREVADYLAGMPAICPVIVHSSNEVCALGMMRVLQDAGWPTYRVTPARGVAWVREVWVDVICSLQRSGLI